MALLNSLASVDGLDVDKISWARCSLFFVQQASHLKQRARLRAGISGNSSPMAPYYPVTTVVSLSRFIRRNSRTGYSFESTTNIAGWLANFKNGFSRQLSLSSICGLQFADTFMVAERRIGRNRKRNDEHKRMRTPAPSTQKRHRAIFIWLPHTSIMAIEWLEFIRRSMCAYATII